jgi:transcriptional regulator with XRE-family HTH domain
VTPDDIKALRKSTGLTQKELAEALELDVSVVRDWEKGERFPTKANCDAMAQIEANPPPRKKGRAKEPLELLADPVFFTLVRKLLAHATLRAEVETLAAKFPDPLDGSEDR